MLRVEERTELSTLRSMASPVVALGATCAVGALLFLYLGKDPVRGLELSVFWQTSGEAYSADEGTVHSVSLPEESKRVPFEARLPLTPTSWDGAYVKIRWVVRVRDGTGGVWDAPIEVVPGG